MNSKKEDTKCISEYIIEIDKHHSPKLQDSSIPSKNCEDSYDKKDSYIDKDNMLSLEDFSSDFEEQLKKSRKSRDTKENSSRIQTSKFGYKI